MKIVLLGYMASGKSVIGKALAKKLHLKSIDLDSYIEKKEKLSIAKIFETKGEIAFRMMEHAYLKEILFSNDKYILSVGGGTPCYAGNIDLITNHSNSFYLKASIETLFNRITNEKNKRPLVKDILHTNLKEFIAKHLFERNLFYNQASYLIDVNDKTIDEIVNSLTELIYLDKN